MSLPPAPNRSAPLRAWQVWAGRALQSQPRRFAHLQGVLARAQRIGAPAYWSPDEQQTLMRCALLHDIGHAVDPQQTRHHSLTGFEILCHLGLRREANVVLLHSGAAMEARMRNEYEPWEGWPLADPEILAALDYLDATTSAEGLPVSVNQRAHAIAERYGGDSPAARAFWLNRSRVRTGWEILGRPDPPA